MRLFIGIDPDPAIHERIVAFMSELRRRAPDARWVSPDSLHVTLKFIGEVSDSTFNSIRDALQSVQAAPFELRFHGAGFFGRHKSGSVFWAGVDGSAQLPALAAAVNSALEPLGIAAGQQPYQPHLTLARAGSRGGKPNVPVFQQLLNTLGPDRERDFGTMTAKEFILYESKLSPAGARYARLERFPLT